MTKDEALRLALKALKETWYHVGTFSPTDEAIELYDKAIRAIKEALETKDEPVAWGMEKDGVILDVICPDEHEREEGEYTIPVYTQPQRTWVKLTDEEIETIYAECNVWDKFEYERMLEAKLKEKNHD